jgi:hypothetical protein
MGGAVILTPRAAGLALLRLARAVLRGRPLEAPARTPAMPRPWGLVERLRGAARRLLGPPAAPADRDLTVPIRLTRAEVEHGSRRRLTLEREGGREEVVVTIPVGVRPGTRLRLRGKGHRSPDGRVGDAFLRVELQD